MTTLREAIQSTATFLSSSISTETGLPLIQRLYNTIPPSWTPPEDSLTQHSEIILYSLDLLKTIHAANVRENNQLGIKDWRQANALIEIILVLGLYKVLSSGVGIPENRRVKSIFLAHEGRRHDFSEEERRFLLQSIISGLKGIVVEGGEIGEMLQRKHLIDILTGIIELSFNPLFPEDERLPWNTQYETLLSAYSSSIQC